MFYPALPSLRVGRVRASFIETAAAEERNAFRIEPLEQRVLLAATLPDLTPWADQARDFVYGWELDTNTQPGHTLLRLTSTIANVGQGAFEVRGSTVNGDGTQDVLQRIYNDDGTFTDVLAGKFVHHPGHSHTHFDGLAQYNLRATTAGNGVGGLVAGGLKTSFCLVDTVKYSPAVPGTPGSAQYVTCTTTRQGISLGWADIYDKSLPDQWIDITNIPTGRYWLEVVADPDEHVQETNETNNVVRIQIDLPGSGAVFNQSIVASGLVDPLTMAFSPDGKLFVVEQGGTMEVWQDNVRLQADFFRDTPIQTQTANERGLLGVTFDPNYATNRFVYVYYTTTAADAHHRLSRFVANAAGDLALPSSEQILLELDPHSANQHTGGAMHFGPDGKLYLSTGDNGNQNNGTAVHNAQRMDRLYGKILRLNPDGTIPSDNPFIAQTTGKYQSIWALGFRNPFTFAIQPGTGRMFINDVGQSNWEEINDGLAGRNYGWPATEGDFNQAAFPNFTRPFYAYAHNSTDTPSGCAIVGGVFYNPTSNQFGSDYTGDYFFADYCSSKIYRLDVATKIVTEFASLPVGLDSPLDLRIDADGNLYCLVRNSANDPGRHGVGQVVKISTTASPEPNITQQPPDRVSAIGEDTNFTVIASGVDVTFQWQRATAAAPEDFTNIPGATSPTYTLPNAQPTDNGDRFRVIVTNGFGSATSNVATLTVTSNHAPSASIDLPLLGSPWIGGQTIDFAASGSDQEDGATLPPTAFLWEVRFYHNEDGHEHFHPVASFPDVMNSSFTIPTTGESSPDVWYRIILNVTDSDGATKTYQRDIFPQTVTITLATNPAGLGLTLDGQPAPASFVGIVGMERQISAPATQVLGNNGYAFDSWSDGGAATRTITTPATNATYTANYVPAPIPGVKSEFFDFTTQLSAMPSFVGRTPNVVRTDAQVNFPETAAAPWPGLGTQFGETFASRHTGFLRIDAAGSYTFYLNSNDGSMLYIDDQLVVNNGGNHAMRELSAARTLTAGFHSIRIEFYQNLNNSGLIFSWAGPGIAKQVVPASRLFQTTTSPGNPPTVQNAAAANPSPITGTTTSLSVLGADDGGEGNLNYTWATTGTPPAPVTFSANGTNAAKSSIATFTRAGTYNLAVTITDGGGQTVTSSVSVVVAQTFTSALVSPTTAVVAPGASRQFSATARDQFGDAMAGVAFTWSLDSGGVGSVDANGLYTAPAGTGIAGVRATSGAISAKADVTVQTGPAAFQQDSGADGLVVIEAESNDANVTLGGKTWQPYSAIAGFSGTGARQALANTGVTVNTGYVTGAPRLDFRINFVRTGIHHVWVRGLGPSGSDDTVHVGLNGAAVTSADRIGALPVGAYGWTKSTLDGVVATINVTSVGVHTLNLWMREDGVVVDKVLLTSNAAFTPTGQGPAQSARANGGPPNQPPTVQTAAAATPSPVTGTSTTLSALGADDSGEASLIYTWATTGTPPAPVTFGAGNGTNGAKSMLATFTQAGTYNFIVTIRDASQLTTTSTISVVVSQTLTSVVVAPASATVAPGASQTFTATARDQFGGTIAGASFTWSLDAGSVGSVSAAGVYTAPAGTGTATVRATSGSISGTASVTVQTGPPAYQQDGGADGLVVMEAEANDGNIGQGGKTWQPYTATAGFSGTGALQALTNTGGLVNTGYTTAAPRLDFRINFTRTGVHYVWIRGRGLTGNDDTIHAGLNGAAVASADRIGSFPNSYSWLRTTLDGVVATINVPSVGVHTLNLWMREDGMIVDKVLLTTNPNYTPTGLGPAPSGRSGGAGAQATGFSLPAGGNDDMLSGSSGSFCGCGSHRRTTSSDVLDDGNDEEELLDGPA